MNFDFSSFLYPFTFTYSLLLLILNLGIFLLNRKRNSQLQKLSVIIAARNEDNNLNALLTAINAQSYPEEYFEVLIVDDRSTDNTWKLLKAAREKYSWLKIFRIAVENPYLAGKKAPLALAIDKAENEILVFTDADCLPRKLWLEKINELMTEKADFLCGYSPLIVENPILSCLKNLERASIFAVIAGSFGLNWDLTSVARNQVYRKSVFTKIKGFKGIEKIKSGDDDLLLQKMSPCLKKRNFIFHPLAAVPSLDKSSKKDMIDLETRRASKWKFYPASIKVLTAFVFCYYLLLASSFLLALLHLIHWQSFLLHFIIKTAAEFLLLFTFLLRIKQLRLLICFPLAEILYLPYFIFFALKGTFGKYEWKK